jgi:hypothetical protein
MMIFGVMEGTGKDVDENVIGPSSSTVQTN